MDNQLLLKKILYRSKYRGCKETDFLLGNFFANNANALEQFGLNLCEEFLDEDDMQIYDWIVSNDDFPKKYQKIIASIRNFHKLNK
ncbi:MAG: succinate dehydrogenase assembly factor 2 [Alphaproteobacteria bacterium]